MSIFASKTRSGPIELPMDKPHTVTVRKLTGSEVELAQTESLRGIVEGRSARARVRLMAAVVGQRPAGETDIRHALGDPLIGYDRATLARLGLVAWTYADKSEPASGKPLQAAIDDLDDDALEFIATEVLRVTKPYLFETAEQSAVAKKNG
jgi:hypothetical protein